MELKRLSCDIDGPRLNVTIAGELCSGDLINFSYRVLQAGDKMEKGFTALIDTEKAKFNLIDGLWQKICSQFNELAVAKGVKRVAYVLPTYLFMKCVDCKAPPCVRIFEYSKETAESWLNEEIPVSAKN